MNIFEFLKKYKKDRKQIPSTDLDEKGRDSKGIYRNDFMSRRYSDLCKDAADLTEDAFEGAE